MSDLQLRRLSLPGRRMTALIAVLVGLLLILGAGTVLGHQGGASDAGRIPLVGRTTTICTTSAPPNGKPAEKTQVSAVSVREAPNRAGLLTGSTLKSKRAGTQMLATTSEISSGTINESANLFSLR